MTWVPNSTFRYLRLTFQHYGNPQILFNRCLNLRAGQEERSTGRHMPDYEAAQSPASCLIPTGNLTFNICGGGQVRGSSRVRAHICQD